MKISSDNICICSAIICIVIIILLLVFSAIQNDKIDNFCEDLGYDTFKRVGDSDKFNCCFEISIVDNKYVENRECIVGGTTGLFWEIIK